MLFFSWCMSFGDFFLYPYQSNQRSKSAKLHVLVRTFYRENPNLSSQKFQPIESQTNQGTTRLMTQTGTEMQCNTLIL